MEEKEPKEYNSLTEAEIIAHKYLKNKTGKNLERQEKIGYPDFKIENEYYEIKTVMKQFFTKNQVQKFKEIKEEINIVLICDRQIIGEFKLNIEAFKKVAAPNLVTLSLIMNEEEYNIYRQNQKEINKELRRQFRESIKETKKNNKIIVDPSN